MIEIPIEYLNKVASQVLTISSLLGGFSIAVIANLIVYKSKTPIITGILKSTTVAAGSFLVSIFSLTKIIVMTTQGFPLELVEEDFFLPKVISFASFLIGIFALSIVIALSGWTKSKTTGIFTTIVSIITFILILNSL